MTMATHAELKRGPVVTAAWAASSPAANKLNGHISTSLDETATYPHEAEQVLPQPRVACGQQDRLPGIIDARATGTPRHLLVPRGVQPLRRQPDVVVPACQQPALLGVSRRLQCQGRTTLLPIELLLQHCCTAMHSATLLCMLDSCTLHKDATPVQRV